MRFFVIIFLLLFTVGTALATEISYCKEAIAAAKGKNRKMIIIDEQGVNKIIPNTGERYESGQKVMFEMVGDCGFLEQGIDIDGDGTCDSIMIWMPLVDPSYGVFFTLYKIQMCNVI